MGVAMVRSRRDLYLARDPRRIRPARPKLVWKVVHGPAPAGARELGTCTRANGLSPWPAWPAGAVMGHYGPLLTAMGRYGPLGPLGPLGRARPSEPTYTQFPEGILRTPE